MQDLVCQNCGSSGKIVLVGQIYAPIESLDRSLYVYVCNRRACSLSSKGWIVVRNQKMSDNEPEKSIVSKVVAPPIPEKTPVKTSIWDLSSVNDTLLNDEDDLLELLNKRDETLKSTPIKPSSSSSGKKGKTSDKKNVASAPPAAPVPTENMLITPEVLPEFKVTELEDPFDESLFHPMKGNVGEEEDENDLLPFDANFDNAHIQALLESYLKEEDDAEAIDAIRVYQRRCDGNYEEEEEQQAISKPSADESFQTSFFEQDRQAIQTKPIKTAKEGKSSTSKTISKKPSNSQQDPPIKKGGENSSEAPGDFDDREDCDNEEAGGDAEKKFLDNSPAQQQKKRAELYFQQRISVEPRQVLRYCYNGQPLWISSPNPLEEKTSVIPPCSICGEARVYECQLMPALLSLVHAPSNQKNVIAPPVTTIGNPPTSVENAKEQLSNDLRARLGDDFDFGVVTIWSCPNSCEGETREIPIVQPPPDIHDL